MLVAVTIRLKRIGTNKKPVFRLVAVDQRWGSEKGRVDDLGTVDPRAKEATCQNLKSEKITKWIKVGAIVSPSAGQLLKKLGLDPKVVKAS
jgi:small subunit ribosomal protein S16